MSAAVSVEGNWSPPLPGKNLARLVGSEGWGRLPASVAAPFGTDCLDAQFAGEGRFEASAIGRIFAVFGLAFGRPLPVRTGTAHVHIRVGPSPAGEAWTRSYRFADGEEVVHSVKHSGDGPWLEERAGPLIMRLRVFEEGGALVFACIDFRLRFVSIEIPLPLALTPGRIRVEHRDHGSGRFTFTLEARHPWFGLTFRQRCDLHDVGGAR